MLGHSQTLAPLCIQEPAFDAVTGSPVLRRARPAWAGERNKVSALQDKGVMVTPESLDMHVTRCRPARTETVVLVSIWWKPERKNIFSHVGARRQRVENVL